MINILSLLISVVLIFQIEVAIAANSEVQCNGVDIKYTNETQLQQLKDCLHVQGSQSLWKLDSTKFPCFGQCLFKLRGYLSADGDRIEQDKLFAHLNNVIPDEKTRASVIKGLTECNTKFGSNLGTAEDKTCMKFVQYMQCLRDTVADICF